jgi:5-methyltetrahydrofolate--homocysteine methyltransferase
VHPNAGLPNELGGYDETPEEMAALMASYAQAGLLNVIGGCCGTTPEHIRKFRDIADHCRPRKCPSLPPLTQVSGLEVHTIGRERLFTNIGERTNVAGSTQFKKRIEQGKYANALRIAQEQIQNGAQMLDINMDAPLVDSNQAMALFLRHLMGEPDLARVPLMIDSSSFQTLVTGIKHCLGKPVANSISLKEGEESFLSQARELKKLGATVLIMAFDETGQADSHQRKVDIIRRSFTLLTAQAGFLPQDLIFDLNVFAIGTGMTEHDHYALATLTALEELSRTYPHCQFSGGISNLSFAFRGVETIREALNSVFLYHAFQRGLYLGIVNPGQLTVYDQIEPSLRQLCEALIFNQNPHATAELLDLATVLRQQEPAQQGKETPTSVDELTPEERIVAALIKGDDRHVVSDVEEVRLKLKDPLSVINGPLMSGMREVGERFGEGKMFLPQVVKAARVMKKAVGYLRPFIEEHTSSAQSRGTIVLATVKGDVHDIGKSIVGVVLGCNGFEVLDLGVMVPAGEILGKAKEIKADAIGLSGLITPSLQEMIHVAQEMTAQQWTIPLLIGGATTSVKHTALKIEPHYQGRVFHANDASGAAALLSQLFSEDREEITEQTQRQYERIRAQHKRPKIAKRSLMEARALRPVLHWNEKDHPRPTLVQSLIQQTWTPLDLIDWLDWWAFFQTWQLRGKYPAILDHPQKGEEARRLQNSALTLLKSPQWQEALSVGTLCGFFPAQSEEESVVFRNLEDETVTLTFPRQSLPQREDKGHRCLADFIAPPQSGFQDHLGLFAVSTRKAYLDVAASFQERSDDFHSLMIKICADRLAEAATEKLHFQVRTQLWGYDREENLPIEAMLKEQYRGIRPAPGYPACPDHTLKVPIWETLQVKERLGVQLTEHYAMDPPASVCGFFFAHPQAHYFSAGTEEEA